MFLDILYKNTLEKDENTNIINNYKI